MEPQDPLERNSWSRDVRCDATHLTPFAAGLRSFNPRSSQLYFLFLWRETLSVVICADGQPLLPVVGCLGSPWRLRAKHGLHPLCGKNSQLLRMIENKQGEILVIMYLYLYICKHIYPYCIGLKHSPARDFLHQQCREREGTRLAPSEEPSLPRSIQTLFGIETYL